MIQNCTEQILDDVVRIDLVPADTCHFAIPFQVALATMTVPNLSDWTPQTTTHAVIGKADLSVAYNVEDGDDGLMDSAPKLTQQAKTLASGVIVNHSLQAPLVGGFEATQIAANLLHRRDFHVILTTADGTRYLLYSIPNSCEVLMDAAEVHQTATLKVTVQSYSHVIRLE